MNKAGDKGYEKFTEMAKSIYDILEKCVENEDKNVIVIGHNETAYTTEGEKVNKVRTVGKLLDEKIDIPSLFTTVFYAEVKREEEEATYSFLTQSDGSNMAKSPKGMFDYRIPNDYASVFKRIKEYENE